MGLIQKLKELKWKYEEICSNTSVLFRPIIQLGAFQIVWGVLGVFILVMGLPTLFFAFIPPLLGRGLMILFGLALIILLLPFSYLLFYLLSGNITSIYEGVLNKKLGGKRSPKWAFFVHILIVLVVTSVLFHDIVISILDPTKLPHSWDENVAEFLHKFIYSLFFGFLSVVGVSSVGTFIEVEPLALGLSIFFLLSVPFLLVRAITPYLKMLGDKKLISRNFLSKLYFILSRKDLLKAALVINGATFLAFVIAYISVLLGPFMAFHIFKFPGLLLLLGIANLPLILILLVVVIILFLVGAITRFLKSLSLFSNIGSLKYFGFLGGGISIATLSYFSLTRLTEYFPTPKMGPEWAAGLGLYYFFLPIILTSLFSIFYIPASLILTKIHLSMKERILRWVEEGLKASS